MAEPKTNESAPQKKPAGLGDPREPIAIKALHFRGADGVTIPGTQQQVRSLDARPKNGLDSYEIALLPWMRQFRVVVKSNDKNKEARTFFVPESWAMSEPLE